MQDASVLSEGVPQARKWGPEHLFAGLLAIFGLLFIYWLPPGQGADEPSHFPRAYHISEGNLFPEMFDFSEWGGGTLPASVQRTMDACFSVGNNAQAQVNMRAYRALRRMRLHPKDRLRIIYPTAAHYSFVPYIPSAIGIRVARTLGLRVLAQFYAGRVANLAVCVLALFVAIRITPVFKHVFGMTALIPIAVQQCSTYSPDACTLSAVVLLTALLLRLALAEGPALGKRAAAAILALTACLTLCKFPYLVLLLLYAAVPVARMGGGKRYVAFAVALLLTIVCCLPLVKNGQRYIPDRLVDTETASIERQIRTIKNDPLHYGQVLGATVADHGSMWLDQLGHLGWQDTRMNRTPLYLYLMVLVLVALGERALGLPPPWKLKLAAITATIAGGALIVTACYVVGSSPGSQLVYGPQGRYFLPFAPLVLLTLSSRAFQVQADPRLLRTLAGASAAGVLIVATTTLIRRYYITTDLELYVSPAALGITLVLVAVTVGLAGRRWSPAAGWGTVPSAK